MGGALACHLVTALEGAETYLRADKLPVTTVSGGKALFLVFLRSECSLGL